MPVGTNDLGSVSGATRDLLGEIKELQRELNKVNSEIDRAAKKNTELSPELEKRRKELETLFNNAKGQILQSSSKALLSPQASKEVQAEAKKVIDRELREIQTKLARAVLSGGRIDQSMVSRQSQLQGVLEAYNRPAATGQAGGPSAWARRNAAIPEPRIRMGRDIMHAAFVNRGRARGVMNAIEDIRTGNVGMNTVMDIQDGMELSATALKYIGGYAGSSRMLGMAGRVSALAEGAQAAMPLIAGGAVATYALNLPAMNVIGDINSTRAAQNRAADAAAKLRLDKKQIMDAVGYNAPLTPISVRDGMTEMERAKFNYIAKLAGVENYDANPGLWHNGQVNTSRITLTPGMAIEKARNQAAVHISKILTDFQKSPYNIYQAAARKNAPGMSIESVEAIHKGVLGAMAGGDATVLETIKKELAAYDEREAAQATANAGASRQTRWQMRYQERALAELEKENLLQRQDWNKR
jgi:hypothetical protein